MTEEVLSGKSTTRRSALKLGAAAALAVGGIAALGGATKTRAAGSGFTVDIFNPPSRVANTIGGAKLANRHEVVLGPFPAGGGFFSDSYFGMIGNLTAATWVGPGWLSIRPNGATFSYPSVVLHYSGTGQYWTNLFIVRFGPPPALATTASDGKIIVRCGGGATNFVIDLIGFLGPDQ